MKKASHWHTATLVVAISIGVSAQSRTVDNGALADEQDGTNWLAYGRTFSEDRYSPLNQINPETVARLGLAWSLELPGFNNVTSQPLAVDGVIYFAVGQAVVHAVDARTGRLLWRYDPQVARVAGRKLRWAWGSRGLSFWNGKVYVGTMDGRLIAIDAKSGSPLWSALTVDPSDDRYITGAPRVFNGKIIIGHGGGDVGVTRGYVTTYDAETGKKLWRFYTIPGDPSKGFESKAMEMAAKTWRGKWWKVAGGAAVWNSITYDRDLNRVYIATGNATPWNSNLRGGGDNLFAASIVALDADSGKYAWHYQVNPGDSWDYDACQDMVLTTILYKGKSHKVLMQAPKNGFFYVIDRETGKLLSAEKIGKVTWADHIDIATGRPVELPNIRYKSAEILLWPGETGVHDTPPMSYSPKSGLVYIPTRELPGLYNGRGVNPAGWVSRPHVVNTGLNFESSSASTGIAPELSPEMGTSALLAWDPAAQKAVWKDPTPGFWNGGTIATAGNLVFQGQVDGKLVAHAADSGARLWQYDAHNGIVAPPITFMVAGKQYVSVLVGVGGAGSVLGSLSTQFGWQAGVNPRRLLTFALDEKAELPPSPLPTQAVPLDDPTFVVDASKAERGRSLFGDCVLCHGPGAVSGGAAPDLRASAIPLNADAFERVVRQGALESRGMPRYRELTDSQLESLRHYLRASARESLKAQPKFGEANK
jgi:quinohemoprotein ethanol dehydrogenase